MRRIFLIVFLLFVLFEAEAQNNNIRFKHITSKDGLAQNNVLAILQDSQGFMWFGTRDGLNRFDGYNFRLFQNNPNDSNSISNNFVRAICEDREGYLWVGTVGGGLDRYDRKREVFRSFNVLADSGSRLPGVMVSSIIEDSEGNLWIGTIGDGLAMLNKSRTRFVTYQHDPADPGSLNDSNIRTLMEDKDGNIWIGFWQPAGLNIFNRETGEFESHHHNPSDDNTIPGNFVRAFYESEDGHIYIGTDGGGMSCYTPSQERFTNYRHVPENPNTISHDVVSAFAEDDNENIWIGTENGGLCLYDPRKEVFTRMYQDDIDNESLNDNSIYSLYKDPEGNIWAGTYTGGVNVFLKDDNLFGHFRRNSSSESLSHNNVLCFEQDHLGNMWIGTDGGGLNLFDVGSNTFKAFRNRRHDENSISSDYVVNVFQDSRQNLWVGTWGGGLNLFNYGDQTFRRFPGNSASGVILDRVWITYEDHFGKLWIGSFYDGLNRYDFDSGEFTEFKSNITDTSSISSNNITTIIEDKYNRLWVGTDQSGLNLYSRETQTFRVFRTDKGNPCSLSDNNIFCVLKDHKGDLWFGTNKGLNRLNADKLTFKKFREADGIGNNMVVGIQEDDDHNLWISSNNGLTRFNPQTGYSRHFNEADGLQDVEFKRGAAFKDRDGFLYFGGINGFNRFHPDSIHFETPGATVKIVDLQINSQSVGIGERDSLLNQSISVSDKVEIPSQYSNFSLHYSALSYGHSDDIEYAYMLENFDRDWHYVGKSRDATYTNLNPGHYFFKVKCLIDGKWREESSVLEVIILPPFWRQWWFKTLMVILVILAFAGFYFWRVKRIRKKNQTLTRLVNERTNEIEKKNAILKEQTQKLMEQRSEMEQSNAAKDKFLSIIAHDLRNPFNSIIGFSELMLNNLRHYSIRKMEKQLTYIYSTAGQTYNLLEDLLLWANSQSGKLTMAPAETDMKHVCSEVIEQFKDQTERKDISMLFSQSENILVWVDPDMFKTILRNLLSNAIKFSHNQGQIHVVVEKTKDFVMVTVSDTGVGINAADQKKLWQVDGSITNRGTDNEKGSGLGLLLCKEFVEKHGGHIWVDSEPCKGSDFKFTIPLYK